MKMDERYKMCLRKRRYDTKALASATALTAGARSRKQLRVYRCPYCQLWHITAKPFDFNQFKGQARRSLWSTA